MNVRELMRSPVHTCRPQDSLERAARSLWEHDCGVLPVVDEAGRAVATITDRDICMAAYTRGMRLAELRVAESMSATLVACRADEDLEVAAHRMAEHAVRRLPVVDADGRVIGVLSLNDLARAAGHDKSAARSALRVLAEVSRLRTTSRDAAAGAAARRSGAAAGWQPVANAPRAAVLTSSKVEPEC